MMPKGLREQRAIVQKIVNGKHGPYAVALSDDERRLNITFALSPEVWSGESPPQPGTIVLLSGLLRKRAGWRASKSRHLTPDDEQPARSMEQ